MAATDPMTSEHRRFSIHLPRPRWFGMAAVVLSVVAGAVLLTLCVDLLSSAFAIGGKRAVADMTSLLDFVFRSALHAITESAPTIAGFLASAGLVLLLVRWINRLHHPRTLSSG
jgi:hypothetical protein